MRDGHAQRILPKLAEVGYEGKRAVEAIASVGLVAGLSGSARVPFFAGKLGDAKLQRLHSSLRLCSTDVRGVRAWCAMRGPHLLAGPPPWRDLQR